MQAFRRIVLKNGVRLLLCAFAASCESRAAACR